MQAEGEGLRASCCALPIGSCASFLCVHCKNVRISTDILWRVFDILTQPVTYTFASVAMWARFIDLRIHRYTEPVPLKYRKLATKYLSIYGYFSQCTNVSRSVDVHLQQCNASKHCAFTILLLSVLTARCYEHDVCPSVCNVGGLRPHIAPVKMVT